MPVQWNVYENFQALLKAGTYHLALEALLFLWIIWLLTKKPNSKHNAKLSKKEEEQLLSEWEPEPLINRTPPKPASPLRVISGKVGLFMNVNGRKVLNVASHNYLNFSSRREIEERAVKCLNVYGVGSCGPRGFYGTSEVHLELEDRIAKFFGCEMAALYSYGFSTIASAIPAYAKSGDLIFADERVNFAIQRGLDASRSTIVYFRHNDTEHLEQLLLEQERKDKKNVKKAAATRKFLLIEGIYVNTGQICPLPDLVRLRRRFKLRLFIDESTSFATLGSKARGVTDHFNVPGDEIDLMMVSLESAAASSGGFTVGTKFVVDHQRLCGLGYCFSASLPPMLAAASIQTFDILEKEGGDLVVNLQDVCRKVHSALQGLSNKFHLMGDEISPVKHLELTEHLQDRETEEQLLRDIVQKVEENGVCLVVACHVVTQSHSPPPPSIRLAVNKDFSDEHIGSIRDALQIAFQELKLL